MRHCCIRAAWSLMVAMALTALLTSCSCMHNGTGGGPEPENPGHVCPPCPPCPPVAPPADPLAGSTLDDGLDDVARTQFIGKAIAATVRIHSISYIGGKGISDYGGTGVIINDRHVLTAAHVVENADYIRVTVRRLEPDGLTIRELTTIPMRVVARDGAAHPDIALLEVTHRDRFVDIMPVATRGHVPRHDDLVWHFGRTTRWQRGKVIGRVATDDRRRDVRNTFEADFLVQPGDSGGPVVSPDGRCVGIILRRDTEAASGFFVTVDDGMDALLRVLRRPISSTR